jgi:hypothetical protein
MNRLEATSGLPITAAARAARRTNIEWNDDDVNLIVELQSWFGTKYVNHVSF